MPAFAVIVPCHRVIGANGTLTGYAGGLERKRWLLRYHDIVLARQDEILDLVQLEAGKARRHALEEVLDALDAGVPSRLRQVVRNG